MRFNDGMTFNTESKALKPIKKSDGWYVVGAGMLIPVADLDEALEVIKELRPEQEKEDDR